MCAMSDVMVRQSKPEGAELRTHLHLEESLPWTAAS